jgi:hypothetical protein
MQPQIPLEKNRKYVGYTMHSHDYVYEKALSLTMPEVKGLWHEYEHQFKDVQLPSTKRTEAWIHLQVFSEILREKGGWNNESRRPMNGSVTNPTASRYGSYGAEDYFTNPAYGWAE